MICFVDMEHEQALQDAEERALHETHLRDVRCRLEETSDAQCQVRRYQDVTAEWLDTAGARALVIGGNVTDWRAYDARNLEKLYQIVRSGSLPILGLCGGLQLISMAHGASVGPIRKLKETKPDPQHHYAAGYLKEWGFKSVRVLQPDPLFAGLKKPVFLQAHYWEVKNIPEGFQLLASSDMCQVQVLKKDGGIVYGTQFHPEAYICKPSDRHNWLVEFVYPTGYNQVQPDGRQLLINFFRLTGILDRPQHTPLHQ